MKTTQSEIRNFCAIDCTKDETPLIGKCLRLIVFSIGIYGMNGAVFMDETGNLYKITKGNTLLSKYL